jgi:hypothetical protein
MICCCRPRIALHVPGYKPRLKGYCRAWATLLLVVPCFIKLSSRTVGGLSGLRTRIDAYIRLPVPVPVFSCDPSVAMLVITVLLVLVGTHFGLVRVHCCSVCSCMLFCCFSIMLLLIACDDDSIACASGALHQCPVSVLPVLICSLAFLLGLYLCSW